MKHHCGDIAPGPGLPERAKNHDCPNEATRVSTLYEGLDVYVCDIDHGGFFEPWRAGEPDAAIRPLTLEERGDTIAQLRQILKDWDDGIIARGEVDSFVAKIFQKPFFEAMEKGETWQECGSCCCSGHRPDRTFKVEITIEPHGFIAKRCD